MAPVFERIEITLGQLSTNLVNSTKTSKTDNTVSSKTKIVAFLFVLANIGRMAK